MNHSKVHYVVANPKTRMIPKWVMLSQTAWYRTATGAGVRQACVCKYEHFTIISFIFYYNVEQMTTTIQNRPILYCCCHLFKFMLYTEVLLTQQASFTQNMCGLSTISWFWFWTNIIQRMWINHYIFYYRMFFSFSSNKAMLFMAMLYSKVLRLSLYQPIVSKIVIHLY